MVSIVVMLYSGIFAQPPILTVSNGAVEVSLLEVRYGDFCFKYSYWKQDTRVYEIIRVEEGKEGYFIKLRTKNMGSESCTLFFYLLTSKGEKRPFKMGTEKIVFKKLNVTSEQKALIEKCTGEPEDIIRDMVSLYYLSIADIPPKDTKDVWLLYGLEPDEKAIKLKVIADCGLTKREIYSLEIQLPER